MDAFDLLVQLNNEVEEHGRLPQVEERKYINPRDAERIRQYLNAYGIVVEVRIGLEELIVDAQYMDERMQYDMDDVISRLGYWRKSTKRVKERGNGRFDARYEIVPLK